MTISIEVAYLQPPITEARIAEEIYDRLVRLGFSGSLTKLNGSMECNTRIDPPARFKITITDSKT